MLKLFVYRKKMNADVWPGISGTYHLLLDGKFQHRHRGPLILTSRLNPSLDSHGGGSAEPPQIGHFPRQYLCKFAVQGIVPD